MITGFFSCLPEVAGCPKSLGDNSKFLLLTGYGIRHTSPALTRSCLPAAYPLLTRGLNDAEAHEVSRCRREAQHEQRGVPVGQRIARARTARQAERREVLLPAISECRGQEPAPHDQRPNVLAPDEVRKQARELLVDVARGGDPAEKRSA